MNKDTKTPLPFTDEHRYLLEKGLLDSRFEALYWQYTLQHYNDLDIGVKYILLATSGTGAVASWTIWKSAPIAWQVLSSVSTLIALHQSVVKYAPIVETLARVHDRYVDLQNRYELLWLRRDSLTGSDVISEIVGLRKIEATIKHDTQKFKVILYYRSVVQSDMLKERGFEISAEI